MIIVKIVALWVTLDSMVAEHVKIRSKLLTNMPYNMSKYESTSSMYETFLEVITPILETYNFFPAQEREAHLYKNFTTHATILNRYNNITNMAEKSSPELNVTTEKILLDQLIIQEGLIEKELKTEKSSRELNVTTENILLDQFIIHEGLIEKELKTSMQDTLENKGEVSLLKENVTTITQDILNDKDKLLDMQENLLFSELNTTRYDERLMQEILLSPEFNIIKDSYMDKDTVKMEEKLPSPELNLAIEDLVKEQQLVVQDKLQIQPTVVNVLGSEPIKKVQALKGSRIICGVDNSPESMVQEGKAEIETYPWLGWLYYPWGDSIVTTVVVLVHRQLVIASALHINNLPKTDFRAKSKVVMGRNCSGASLRVLTYNYHPEYRAGTYSALVLIQLDTSALEQDLRPICAPPKTITEPIFHTMVLSDDCNSSKMTIYETQYVPLDQCKHFYRRTGLDIETIWPTHAACGRARAGGECVWRSGAALVVRQHGRWHLLGFGVSGPGCSAPARFLDYGQYRRWVAASALRVGRPALTRLAHNHLVLRRSLTHIQRFGPCDPEEMETELFTDRTEIRPPPPEELKHRGGHITYNLTILANVDYSCIVFRADHQREMAFSSKPKIMLRRFCRTPAPLCYDAGVLQIDFFIHIFYYRQIAYKMSAYGQHWKVVDAKALTKYTNEKKELAKISFGW